MADFAKEVFMEKIDEQWEDFGEPKLEADCEFKKTEPTRENVWVEANTFTLKKQK